MGSVGAAFLAAGVKSPKSNSAKSKHESSPAKMHLELSDFQPKSMLHVPETKVPRASFPVIDIHTHLSWAAADKNGVSLGEEMKYLAEPRDLLEVMDRRNLRTLVNLTGGIGAGLE